MENPNVFDVIGVGSNNTLVSIGVVSGVNVGQKNSLCCNVGFLQGDKGELFSWRILLGQKKSHSPLAVPFLPVESHCAVSTRKGIGCAVAPKPEMLKPLLIPDEPCSGTSQDGAAGLHNAEAC